MRVTPSYLPYYHNRKGWCRVGDIERFILELFGYVAIGVIAFLVNRRDTSAKLAAARVGTDTQQAQTTSAINDALRRIDTEIIARKDAETKVDELRGMLTIERETLIADRTKFDQQIVGLNEKIDRQRSEIDVLNDHVAGLRAERDQLKLDRAQIQHERDEARKEVTTLSGKLSGTEERLANAERQILQLTAQNLASELLFSRLNISLVATVANPTPPLPADAVPTA
jgi:chromosome segregation ATPase